jgi:hypothetical protein
MALGIKSDFNYTEFLKITKNIDDIFAKRIEVAAQMFVNEAQIMTNEFRAVQNDPKLHLPYPKGSKKAKRTVKSKKEKDADMGKAVAYAKAHADIPLPTKRTPWINRTFRAARGVHSYVERTPESIAVGLYHTMAYGAYLEYAQNRKYAVIEPIVRQHTPKLLDKINLLFKGD